MKFTEQEIERLKGWEVTQRAWFHNGKLKPERKIELDKVGFDFTSQKKVRPYEEALKFVRSLKLTSIKEWNDYCKSGKKPKDIPRNLYGSYPNEWRGIRYWLISDDAKPRVGGWWSYDKCIKFVHKLGLKSREEWGMYCDGKMKNLPPRPQELPKYPNQLFRHTRWKSWGEWTGHQNPCSGYIEYPTFKKAKSILRGKGLSKTTYGQFRKDNPKFKLPGSPYRVYEKEWNGWADYFGTRNKKGGWLTFVQAKKFVHSLNLKSSRDWKRWYDKNLPTNLPKCPSSAYRKQWVSIADWLGVQERYDCWASYSDARDYVRKHKVSSMRHYRRWVKAQQSKIRLPAKPDVVYKDKGWKSIEHFLGK